MLTQQQYVVLSLELHLFFARIMKEHSLFLEIGFTPKNSDFSKEASQHKQQFETVLQNAAQLGNGIVSQNTLSANEFITDYTLGSEQKTQNFTGVPINQDITKMEATMHSGNNSWIPPDLMQGVKNLNMRVIPLLNGLIGFKIRVLNSVLSCQMFTVNYPLLIEHILREANLYRAHLMALEINRNPNDNIKETELFWDQIMMEHALFIRGLLDPTENELIQTVDSFSKDYANLIQQANQANDMIIHSVTQDTLQETLKYRDFKEAGTKGIAECKIRSIILPLLADHVLREANHYIRLLKQI